MNEMEPQVSQNCWQVAGDWFQLTENACGCPTSHSPPTGLMEAGPGVCESGTPALPPGGSAESPRSTKQPAAIPVIASAIMPSYVLFMPRRCAMPGPTIALNEIGRLELCRQPSNVRFPTPADHSLTTSRGPGTQHVRCHLDLRGRRGGLWTTEARERAGPEWHGGAIRQQLFDRTPAIVREQDLACGVHVGSAPSRERCPTGRRSASI